MRKNQIIVILSSILLFLILYFGFDKVPPKQKILEKSRINNIESTGITNLTQEAESKLNDEKKNIIKAIQLDLEKSGNDTLKRIQILQTLSGTWFELGFPAISGFYAEEIALIEKTEESWSLAGTTYSICVKKTEDNKTKDFCSKRAIKAFENAISIEPEKVEPRVNLAICYIDNPLANNPMQGVLMLRELNVKHPENVGILNQLGRLALETNQTEKAIERLETAIKLDPKNNNTICLLAQAYLNAGFGDKAKLYQNKCVN